MARPKRNRRISLAPKIKGVRPIDETANQAMSLDLEEYESIRLCDYELLNQVDAARIMNVSRPTFSRIYESARRKVAKAFVEGSILMFEGGKVYFDSSWFFCDDCGVWFNSFDENAHNVSCPLCKSAGVEQFLSELQEQNFTIALCTSCQKRKRVHKGKKWDLVCPDCNELLTVK
ncbi:MAG: DUF134 domain-containing protein [Bacteroidales bacterium]|jgi:predicted DNA-binding protein (UPF0251 family)|nr:DUF134 domain-containing protein [Bacteroidales bacterium]